MLPLKILDCLVALQLLGVPPKPAGSRGGREDGLRARVRGAASARGCECARLRERAAARALCCAGACSASPDPGQNRTVTGLQRRPRLAPDTPTPFLLLETELRAVAGQRPLSPRRLDTATQVL